MFEIIPNWHPMLVHFTIALLSISTVLFYTAVILKQKPYAITLLKTAHINLWLGAIITPLTLLAGWDAYNTVNHDAPSHFAMTDHRNWAIVTAIVWFAIAFWAALKARKTWHHGAVFYLVIAIATIMLGITGLKGGEVVYRHGTGVMRIPVVIGDGGHDSHSHDDMAHDEIPVPVPMDDMKPKENHDNHPH